MMIILSGLPGFPCAPVKASHISWPPPISQDPGSSQIAKGTFTSPIAVLPLLDDMIRSLVFDSLWTIPKPRHAESMNRYSPQGSRDCPDKPIHHPRLLYASRTLYVFLARLIQDVARTQTTRQYVRRQKTLAVPTRQTERAAMSTSGDKARSRNSF